MEKNKQVVGSIRDEALFLVSKGLPIIPLCSPNHRGMSDIHKQKCHSPGKSPIIKNWPSWSATSREDVIDWFRSAKKQEASINIGVPLGTPSGLVGLDIDNRDGEVILLALSNNDLPPTWEYTTGNGRRLLYRLPKGITTRKVKLSGTNKHSGLEILCDGQQTVLPSSVHANGTRYEWKQGRSPRDIDLADCPMWVLEKIDASNTIDESDKEIIQATTDTPMESDPVTEEEWSKTLHEGERNEGLTRLIGSAFAQGHTKEQVWIKAKEFNTNFCDPSLTDNEVGIIIDSIELREKMNQSKKTASASGTKAKAPVLRPTKFIQTWLIQQRDIGFLWKYSVDMGTFFRCDESSGPWELLDLDYVKAILRKSLIDIKKGGTITWDKSQNVNECVEALKSQLVRPGEDNLFDMGFNLFTNAWEHSPLDIVCLDNGIYNWREQALLPWSSDIYTTLKLPVEYDPTANCPNWIKALDEWIPDPNTIAFLQEFIGLCLIPDTSFKTAIFLYGTGSNGKSMFIDAISKLFGKGLISIPLNRLSARFTIAYLQNKLVNICGDIDAKYLEDTGVIKALIGGDVVHGELKMGKSFDFIPVSRFIFSTNKLPPVADKTHGWYNRWKYIKFPRIFNTNPSYRIEYGRLFTEELSGILNWAIEGLVRLKANNTWTESETMRKSEIEYRSENDNVAAFLDDFVNKANTSSDYISTSVLHKCYVEWLGENLNGARQVSIIEFSKRVQTYGFSKNIKRIDNKQLNVFTYMEVNPEYKETYENYLNLF